MIRTVTFENTEYADIPARFEAGTPNIAGAVGFGAAVDYVTALGLDRVEGHEQAMLAYATDRLREVPGLTIYGTTPDKASIVSFTLEGAYPHDIGRSEEYTSELQSLMRISYDVFCLKKKNNIR